MDFTTQSLVRLKFNQPSGHFITDPPSNFSPIPDQQLFHAKTSDNSQRNYERADQLCIRWIEASYSNGKEVFHHQPTSILDQGAPKYKNNTE